MFVRSRDVLTPATLLLAFALDFGVRATPAAAQPPPNASALAEGLFQDARALLNKQQYAAACPKFAESYHIDPKVGTLMNLARCHEKEGKTATAWAEYVDASGLASRAGQVDRARVAQESAATLGGSLAHVVLRAEHPEGITITLDGQAMSVAALGTRIPVDPGPHEVGATSPDHKPFQVSLVIAPGPVDHAVLIPALDTVPPVTVVAVAVPLPPVDMPPPPRTPVRGYALLGAGGGAIAVGAAFGIVAFAEQAAANRQCGSAVCQQQANSDVSTMKATAAVSTVAIGAGVVAAGLGVYFLRHDRHRQDSTGASAAWIEVGPWMSGLAARGAF